jgi:hypothetical protein
MILDGLEDPALVGSQRGAVPVGHRRRPLTAIWYRIINDPLQIYLAVTCWYKVLSGNVQPRKIWSKLPCQGERSKEARRRPRCGRAGVPAI